MKNGFLSTYFNKKVFKQYAAPYALADVALTVLLVANGSLPFVALALATSAIAAGGINKWQEHATGKPFWKPKTPIYGL